MKRFFMVLIGLMAGFAVFGTTAHAETTAAPVQAFRQPMMMCGGNMGAGCPMTIMIDVLKLERKLAAGVPAGQKKALLAEIDKKIAALETAAAAMPCMAPNAKGSPMPCMPLQPQSATQPSGTPQNGSTMTMNLPCCPAPNAAPAAPAPKK
jgi:hypothetical protein